VTNHLLLPRSNWSVLNTGLLELRSHPAQELVLSGDDLRFLEQIGLVDVDGHLSNTGQELCTLAHVRNDIAAVNAITHAILRDAPATQAMLQALSGLKEVSVSQARMALIFAGLDETDVDARLTNFLTILNAGKVIVYNRKARTIQLLVSPRQLAAPSHIYIDSSRPYSNDLWIREIIRECRGSIMWLDKYFQKEAFEWIWREANAENISQVRIISTVDDKGVDSVALADYRRLKKELAAKGIVIDWRVLKRRESHDFHDRWILDDDSLCYNLPSINSIKSGQRSELHRSPNRPEIKEIFEDYYSAAQPV